MTCLFTHYTTGSIESLRSSTWNLSKKEVVPTLDLMLRGQQTVLALSWMAPATSIHCVRKLPLNSSPKNSAFPNLCKIWTSVNALADYQLTKILQSYLIRTFQWESFECRQALSSNARSGSLMWFELHMRGIRKIQLWWFKTQQVLMSTLDTPKLSIQEVSETAHPNDEA